MYSLNAYYKWICEYAYINANRYMYADLCVCIKVPYTASMHKNIDCFS